MSDRSSSVKFHPFKHISIRVPWHDSSWNGCVCKNPKENASCLVLDRIRETRDDKKESDVAGVAIEDIESENWPACLAERGTFMAPFEITRDISHPYSSSKEYSHFKTTSLRQPIYSAAAIPFRWMNKKNAWKIAEFYGLDVDPEREPKSPEWLKNSKWVQNHLNQKALLEHFFGMLEPENSLCFFYAKLTPLAEDERRVIIGVGRAKNIGELIEYEYSLKKERRSYIWDRLIQHSISPDFSDGFLLPYHEILETAEYDPSINIEDYIAFAPEDRRTEFSYASEHVTHDAAIASLLSCKKAIENSKKIVDGPWDHVLKWIDRRLSELWKLRGAYPGLGVALTAFGIEQGSLLAYEIESSLEENEDPWPLVDKVFKDPSILSLAMQPLITKSLQETWELINTKKTDRMSLLKLIARMELTVDQATRFYVKEIRKENGINCTNEELLQNPYLLFENDRDSPDPISVWTIDHGVFPPHSIRETYPLPLPSLVTDPTDVRRVRALVVNTLEQAASNGHTLMSRDDLVSYIRNLTIEPSCPIYEDLLESKDFSPVVIKCCLADESLAYQLERLATMGNIIRSTVEKRIKGKRHIVDVDWRHQLDEEFGKISDEDEERARNEKSQALKELAESRISVLIGPAGTGKTTLLSILCKQKQIIDGGILLLAPTGKARVRLHQTTNFPAQTLAQFLNSKDRYDGATGKYHTSDQEKIDCGRTVIIDEASMLTEEQLGSLFDALKSVDRYILVGDPCQLPPIGAGRPFVDIVNLLKPSNVDLLPIKVSKCYAELSINKRQTGGDREDLQLAEWFSGRSLCPGEDEVLTHIIASDSTVHIRMVSWRDAEDLRSKLLQILVDELNLKAINDQIGFDISLGGNQSGPYVYFNCSCGECADKWQIMSPVKGLPHGVREINRLIQINLRKNTRNLANIRKKRRIPKPLGPEGILYGDKVINTINNWREGYPDKDHLNPDEDPLNYVANGEIGIAVGTFATNKNYKEKNLDSIKEMLKHLNIEFSSQPGYTYGYTTKDFEDESYPILELAYAITVHKSQGSEFNLCILILPNPCRLLSREMLYTALTRQRDRIVLLHQGEISEIFNYSSDYYSETLRRMTNLFNPPAPRKIKDRFLEEKLINISSKGEPMRSKSEVIIADLLTDAGTEYYYEKPLVGTDGQKKYPDFTIEDYESGITYYWEHCGMLRDNEYRKRWERKLAWYREQKILPLEEGGGELGTLIITYDTLEGGINAKEIKELIAEL